MVRGNRFLEFDLRGPKCDSWVKTQAAHTLNGVILFEEKNFVRQLLKAQDPLVGVGPREN